jgi:hypothetical protein
MYVATVFLDQDGVINEKIQNGSPSALWPPLRHGMGVVIKSMASTINITKETRPQM